MTLTLEAADQIDADGADAARRGRAVVDVGLTTGSGIAVVAGRTDASRIVISDAAFCVASTHVLANGAGIDASAIDAFLVQVAVVVLGALGLAAASDGIALVAAVAETDGFVLADLALGVGAAIDVVTGVGALAGHTCLTQRTFCVGLTSSYASALDTLSSLSVDCCLDARR